MFKYLKIVILFISLSVVNLVYSQCAITSITTVSTPYCVTGSNLYSQEIIVTYNNPPGGGSTTLNVNGKPFAIIGSPQTVVLQNLPTNGLPVNVSASFSSNPGCNLTVNNLFTAPVNCPGNVPDQINQFGGCDFSDDNGLEFFYFDYSSNPDTASTAVLQFVGNQ